MSVHRDWLDQLKQFSSSKLRLPPPSLEELQIEYLEIKPGVSMKAKLPFQDRFTNPMGTFQGGFLAAGIDEVFGPLSYITNAGPTMTLSMNFTFLKAFTQDFGFCLIEAQVLKETGNFIFMRAEVKTESGELLAHAETHVNKVKKL